ncbi:MAG: hypothetical protein JOZ51_23755 [Chloroflexi bacterium]|nr:hypothetical protein [Chloroflexota bacterium]
MSTDLSLERAIQALRAGDRETGRALLHELTQAEPLRPEGWLWLAAAQDDPIQKRVCLQQALALDPGNQHAAAGLRALEQQTGSPTIQPTAATAPITEPAAVETPATANVANRLAQPRFTTTGKRERRISWPIVALVGALVILIPLAIWLFGQGPAAQATVSAAALLLVIEHVALVWTVDVEQMDQAEQSRS